MSCCKEHKLDKLTFYIEFDKNPNKNCKNTIHFFQKVHCKRISTQTEIPDDSSADMTNYIYSLNTCSENICIVRSKYMKMGCNGQQDQYVIGWR